MDKDEAIHTCTYSRTMNQEYPRKCVHCGKVEALEQQAQEPLTRAQQVIRANNTAQPTQEPVAWTKESELTRVTTLRFPMAMWKNKYASIENNIPLYTHPHQWQGLTDDEIQELTHYDIKFARAIEQSLREKNT